jgi:uncharacterized protein YbjT (DUF2867 family)
LKEDAAAEEAMMILVTGVTGRVGSKVMRELLAKGRASAGAQRA